MLKTIVTIRIINICAFKRLNISNNILKTRGAAWRVREYINYYKYNRKLAESHNKINYIPVRKFRGLRRSKRKSAAFSLRRHNK